MTVKDKENKQGPRKLLALDGGGIRGVMALEILATIESQLQKALKLNNDFVGSALSCVRQMSERGTPGPRGHGSDWTNR